MHYLGRWRTQKEALIARDRAVLYFGVDRELDYPEEARRLGPLSPEGLRQVVREQVKASTASRFIGVYKRPGASTWYALIRDGDDRAVNLGVYADEAKAAEAVDQATRFFGRPPPNFPGRRLPARSPEDLRLELRIRKSHTRYVGVTRRDAAERPWFFQLKLPDGTHTAVGGYKTDRLAARAYDRAVRYYHLDGPLNFPEKAKELPPTDLDTLRREVQATRKRPCSSRYRGVRWRADRARWAVYIRAKGNLYFVGEYRREREAAEAYDEAARRLLGPAAAARRVNFP